MPIYQNMTNKFIQIKAFDKNGTQCIVTLPPDTEFESDREIQYPGLEQVDQQGNRWIE